ncbi:uncharacterized protein LOC121853870 isoform X2 [Homarus americanus]|uniref:uncharacterized protein LOC121853870 isoform X2 n=1 Tax=Homarus americanus TaxID=6706 RepID=UPI001C44727D|nr:uncharacterized protein LOC121853870 isoform X2 [Homarus americanus]
MRARSVQLVTSWWVVGVWALLGITTGVISVVTVLQPSWYVRYSLLHAQEAHGVVFQVVVSSVGPLGFCRLAAVDTSHVSHTDASFNRPPPSRVHKPDEGMTSSPASVWTFEVSDPLDDTSTNPEMLSTTSLKGPFQTSRLPDESLQEWPPLGIHHTTLSVGSVHLGHTLPVPSPTKGDGADVSSDEGELPEGFGASRNTDKEVTNEAHDTDNILFHVTETYVKVVKEERDNESILQSLEEELDLGVVTGMKEERVILKNEYANTAPGRNTTRHKQEGEVGGQDVDNDTGLTRVNIKTTLSQIIENKNVTEKKNRKRKNKNKKRKKKNKRPKPKKERTKLKKADRGKGSVSGDRQTNNKPEQPNALQHITNSSNVQQLIAELLTQSEDDRRYQDNAVMSQGVALVLFPLGLGSPLARGECGGSSSVYWSGECSFGWSYMLGIVATTLAAYCPCLARLTIFRRYALKEWESINFY